MIPLPSPELCYIIVSFVIYELWVNRHQIHNAIRQAIIDQPQETPVQNIFIRFIFDSQDFNNNEESDDMDEE